MWPTYNLLFIIAHIIAFKCGVKKREKDENLGYNRFVRIFGSSELIECY